VGLNDPHELAGVQLQLTPAFDESLLTTAVIDAVLSTCNDCGGAVEKATESVGGGVVPEPELPPHPMIAEIVTVRRNKPVHRTVVIAATS
jgi:hypothetical protein